MKSSRQLKDLIKKCSKRKKYQCSNTFKKLHDGEIT